VTLGFRFFPAACVAPAVPRASRRGPWPRVFFFWKKARPILFITWCRFNTSENTYESEKVARALPCPEKNCLANDPILRSKANIRAPENTEELEISQPHAQSTT